MLRHEELSAEERAIVDAFAINKHLDHIGGTWDALYSLSAQEAEGCILARRALFGIATEKMACPNCGEITGRSHSRYQGPGPDKWICQPAQPEPEKAVSEIHRPVCLNCWQTDTGHGWKVNGELRYSCASTNKPAQPEPAARELPEAVRRALIVMRSRDSGDLWFAADALETWARSQAAAQPGAVGMSEELERVLQFAQKTTAMRDPSITWDPDHLDKMAILIAAVRSQAVSAQPKPPAREFPMVRRLVSKIRDWKSCAELAMHPTQLDDLCFAALAELDAQPKAVGVPVEDVRAVLSYADAHGMVPIKKRDAVRRWLAAVEGGSDERTETIR